MQGAEVLIAAEGATRALLMNEFPNLTFLHVLGYRVKYSRKKSNLPFVLFLQIPRVLLTIMNEHRWIKRIVKKHKIDAVISDNRFGLYDPSIPCIYITHQLLIKTSNIFTEKIAQNIHYLFIKKYTECWVPDAKDDGLAGELSHPEKLPVHTRYIGPLSRFTFKTAVPIAYDLLITISGPEPQRTIFECIILKGLKSYKGRTLLVRGLPGVDRLPVSPGSHIEIRNHLPASEMNEAMLQSSMIISRSGYTTIMDLVKLHKQAILIPTPGQREQEFLADYVFGKKMFYSVRQEDFSLSKALQDAVDFPFNIPLYEMNEYKKVIRDFLNGINGE